MKQYLRDCGEYDKKIATCHLGTRLYHDLGIYGEVAEDYLEVLANQYHVDLSNFVFERYFPPEFPGKSKISRFLIWFFPYIRNFFGSKEEQYLPITLRMIGQAIIEKKWNFD
ncbi:MAG: DUF1493 family protein [Flavisolibacter sp.]